MTQKDLAIELMRANQGVLTSDAAKEAGVEYKTIQRMHQAGDIEKLEQGLYMDPDHMKDEFFVTQYRCRKGIFSHETALFFHDLSDRSPIRMMLTIPSGYNTRLLKDRENFKFFYVADKLHLIGMITTETPYGHHVKVYDQERTICDCLKNKEQLDSALVNEAVKRYIRMPGMDTFKLLKYAEIFNIRDLVYNYMEILT